MGRHSQTPPKRKLLRKSLPLVTLLTPLANPIAHAAPPEAWDKLAECESSGQWDINTGNGYYGGLQFSLTTWRDFGGTGMPHQATREEQIAVAERTLAKQGWNAWPSCSRKTGVRTYGADPERPAATNVEGTPPTGTAYTVKLGDTLSEIAPHNWEIVAFKNNIENPDLIFVGQVIRL